MDACHILLGRPWQHEQQAIHDIWYNTYHIIKDGRHLTLLPIYEDEAPPPTQTRSVCLMGAHYVLMVEKKEEIPENLF